jgi:phage antirepressor YoqD-like protein
VKASPTVSKSDPKETRLGSTLFGEIAKIDRGGEMPLSRLASFLLQRHPYLCCWMLESKV